MKRKNIAPFVFELNQVINEFVKNKNLFSGGCCFAAYVLADAFAKLGVNYRTVVFQSCDVFHEKDFNKSVNGCGCDHVAIEVTVHGEQVIIGDYSGIMLYYKFWNVKYILRRYRQITPSTILQAYKNNDWNCLYQTENNTSLENRINAIVNKYLTI